MQHQHPSPRYYPSSLEEKLGFDTVKQHILSFCSTDIGKSYVGQIHFSNDKTQIEELLRQTDDMMRLVALGYQSDLPENLVERISELNVLTVEGLYLYEDQLAPLKYLLQSVDDTRKLIVSQQVNYPHLCRLIEAVQPLTASIQAIDRVIDKEGHMRHDASETLKSLAKQIQQKERDVRRILQSKFEYAKKQGWAGDTEITIRNERLVIPVIAEHKRKIPGFVHDDSQSGKFLYIEPIECFDENNLLKELYLERRKEVERILKQLSQTLAPHYQNITFAIRRMGLLDFIRAKARFSAQIQAIVPDIGGADILRLQSARHPLLYLNLSRQNKTVVPLDIQLDSHQRCILVSGPNAGGKSITLKTVGLLQYMLQCGFPVPVKNGSAFRLFSQIFIDIGDNQSIEQNLSSYSSHLKSMKYFINHADDDTLILIDELGTGTDPQLGAPMAEAILDTLFKTGAYGIVTTHFSNLKSYASHTEGMVNAGMMYDLEHLEPLYKLQVGKPGSSFTFEVAKKIGLNKKVLQMAEQKVKGKEYVNLETLLSEAERNRSEAETLKQELKDQEAHYKRLVKDYEQLKADILGNKKKILADAKSQALQLVNEANKDIERTIKQIKETQAEKQKTKQVRQQLQKKAEELSRQLDKNNTPESEMPAAEEKPAKPVPKFEPGMLVKMQGSDAKGEILEISKTKALVLFGLMQTWVKLADLEPYTGKQNGKKDQKAYTAAILSKQVGFNPDLDIRGERGDAALQKVSLWLDDAYMLGQNHLKIIHGRGTGILRKLILEKLKTTHFVKSYSFESEQFGGDGATVIELR